MGLVEDVGEKKALEKLRIERYCCRRMFLTHVELIDKMANYATVVQDDNKDNGKDDKNDDENDDDMLPALAMAKK